MYTSYKEQVDLLNMEQRGVLLTAIMCYAADEPLPEMDGMCQMCFSFIKGNLDRDFEKYQKTCEARREAGKKGGRPKANGSGEKAKKANGFFEIQSKAKKPDNDNDNDNDNDLKDILSGDPTSEYPYKDVIDYLNEKAGTKFKDKSKDSRRHIKARFDEGFTLDDFYKVIDGRCAAWKGDAKMAEYLRPSTLFGTKFEAYLNAKPGRRSMNGFNNFEGRSYDYDNLERLLTGVGS